MNAPKITKISLLHLPFITPDSYEVLVNINNFDKKKHRIIVQVNLKNYELQGNTITIKIPTKPNNNSLVGVMPANNDLRVKAFVYDFVNDKIVEAKLQEFAQKKTTPQVTTAIMARASQAATNPPLIPFGPVNGLVNTVASILGWNKPVKKALKSRRIKKLMVNNGKSLPNLKYEFNVDVYLDDQTAENLGNNQTIEIIVGNTKALAKYYPRKSNQLFAKVAVTFSSILNTSQIFDLTARIVDNPLFGSPQIISVKKVKVMVMADGSVSLVNQESQIIANNNCDVKFKKVSPIILEHEGGYKNEPSKDKGDPTNKGISWPVWKKYAKEDLGIEPTKENQRKLTDEQATIIYRKRYWEPKGYCEMYDLKVALMIYDWSITSGGAIKEVQKLLKNEYQKEIEIDGAMGLKTVRIINSIRNQNELLNKIASNRIEYYEKGANLGWFSEDYLNGLKNRVNKCLNYVL